MGTRSALLISAGSFADDGLAPLRSPAIDSGALAEVMSDPAVGGYVPVSVLHNATAQEVRQAIEQLFTEARRDDLIVLYFAGHGLKDERGRLHFAMADTRLGLFGVPRSFRTGIH